MHVLKVARLKHQYFGTPDDVNPLHLYFNASSLKYQACPIGRISAQRSGTHIAQVMIYLDRHTSIMSHDIDQN